VHSVLQHQKTETKREEQRTGHGKYRFSIVLGNAGMSNGWISVGEKRKVSKRLKYTPFDYVEDDQKVERAQYAHITTMNMTTASELAARNIEASDRMVL
jgi:hypothetical protein